jgi:hypothetical protein
LKKPPVRFFSFGILCLLAAIGLRLVFFDISLTHLPASADEAQGVLQAKSMTRGEIPLLFTGAPYQFPFEAYLHAPLVSLMPRNAFGARYVAFLTSLDALLAFLRTARHLSFIPSWPIPLLLLFPSAYWPLH